MRNQPPNSNQWTGKDGWLGRTARESYKDGDPSSVTLTITSKFLKSMQESVCKAEDFR